VVSAAAQTLIARDREVGRILEKKAFQSGEGLLRNIRHLRATLRRWCKSMEGKRVTYKVGKSSAILSQVFAYDVPEVTCF
jgi:hypothetical protein